MIKTEAWQWRRHADPTLLERDDKMLAELGDDQVLIENRAIGLNPVDWKLMAVPPDAWQDMQIPGVDGMGVIAATGKNAAHLRLGTRVAYHTDLRFDGSFARHTIVSARALIVVPDSVSDASAAAFPCPGLTAWQAMRRVPYLEGENVLVSGAGGAVGGILAQLLAQAGAKVYVTASPRHHDALITGGVVRVFDYHDALWQQALSRSLGEQSLYAAFDTVNQQSAISLADLLGYYGHLVCVQDRIEQSPLPAFTTSISLHEIALAAIHPYGSHKQWGELVQAGEEMLKQVSCGQLVLPRIQTVAFNEIPQALEQLMQNNDGTKYVAVI